MGGGSGATGGGGGTGAALGGGDGNLNVVGGGWGTAAVGGGPKSMFRQGLWMGDDHLLLSDDEHILSDK